MHEFWLSLPGCLPQAEMAGERPEAERCVAPWPIISACRSEDVPLLALLAFSIEGDNVGDAVKLAAAAKRCLRGAAEGLAEGLAEGDGAPPTQWRFPESWQSMYGRPQGLAVY